jgi:hypothetical protein
MVKPSIYIADKLLSAKQGSMGRFEICASTERKSKTSMHHKIAVSTWELNLFLNMTMHVVEKIHCKMVSHNTH